MIFAWSIFDIVNNLSRWIILYELLLWGFGPFEAVIITSIASCYFSILCINKYNLKTQQDFFITKKEHMKIKYSNTG